MSASELQVLDASLIASFADNGDGAAFEQLVARHAALVFSVCRGVLGRHHDAEDAAQATFLTLARRASSLRAHPSIAGWLHRVAWHISTRARSARQLRDARERPALESISASDPPTTADDRLLHEVIANLPEKLRLPIVLHHLEGWSEAETAAVLGVRVGTVSGWLHRGRKRLKEQLQKLGNAPALALAPGAIWMRTDVAPAELIQSIGSLATQTASPRPMVIGLSNAAVQMLRSAVQLRWLTVAAIVAAALFMGAMTWTIMTADSPRNSLAAAAASQKTGWIRGTVFGPSGGPVRGGHVYVYLTAPDAAARRNRAAYVRTDASGNFEIRDLAPAERYFVIVGIPYTGDAPPIEQFKTDIQSPSQTQVEHVVFKAN